MKFYTPDGTEISPEKNEDERKKEFIKYYSQDYFLKEHGNSGIVPGLSRSSKFVEDVIIEILHSGINSRMDVARILAWKTGKIKHRCSEENKKKGCFIYSIDWSNLQEFESNDNLNALPDEMCVRLYSKEFNFQIGKIAGLLLGNRYNLEKTLDSNTEDGWKTLLQKLNRLLCKDNCVQYVGTVYLITLMYFISKGKYPIYDRFAMKAIRAIEEEGVIPKKGSIPYKELKIVDKVINDESEYSYKIYMDNLNRIFPQEEFQFDEKGLAKRELDQALWVYGHLF